MFNPDSIYTFAELAFPTAGVELKTVAQLRPYIVFNMVSSVDGKTTTSETGLEGLGSRSDRQVMNRLRSQVDAVLVGGNTLRVDPFIPTVLPELMAERLENFADRPQPLGIVISRNGNLPLDHRFWQAGKDLRLVFVGQKADQQQLGALRERSQVRQLPSEEIDLAEMLHILFSQFGVRRLLIEGGGALNYSLISQGWADEFFLTFSPHLVGGLENATALAGAGHGLGGDRLKSLELRSCYQHENELFLRYRILP